MYDETPSDMQKQAKSLLHADGKSLWFDKSVTFGTYPNGKAGGCARGRKTQAPWCKFALVLKSCCCAQMTLACMHERRRLVPRARAC
jgi:hypothetical protein